MLCRMRLRDGRGCLATGLNRGCHIKDEGRQVRHGMRPSVSTQRSFSLRHTNPSLCESATLRANEERSEPFLNEISGRHHRHVDDHEGKAPDSISSGAAPAHLGRQNLDHILKHQSPEGPRLSGTRETVPECLRIRDDAPLVKGWSRFRQRRAEEVR